MIFFKPQHLLAFALIVLSFAPVLAQDYEVIFQDDFTTQANPWPKGKWQYGHASIANGTYSISRRQRSGSWYLSGPTTFIDYSANYDVEMKVRFINGSNNGYGMSWAGASAKHTNSFVINAQGQYKIYRFLNGRYDELAGWQPSDVIKKKGEWNVMTLKKRGSAVNIVINDYTIGSIEAPAVLGRNFGMTVNKSMSIEVDYFQVRQDQGPIRLAKDHPIDTKRENLGPKINSSGGDLSPVITADGRQLYIGRYPYKGNIGNPEKEDIYVSDLQPNGSWGPMKNVGRPLNNEGSNFLISITPDGNTALLGNTYRPNGRPRGGGVSISHRTEDGWQVPAPVRIDDYYNRHRFSEMCLDPSGTKLIMALQRDDSKGEKDLYVSFKKGNGSFTAPRPMGILNTFGNEMSPFMAADGETIYFATDGLKGYGGVDIWMSRRLDDSWTNWSEPENLGPIINTPAWDAYFTVPASGDYAYLSASNKEDGSADIYRVKLTGGVKPKTVLIVKGRVLDATTKKPIEALVEYESLTKQTKVGEARSRPAEGTYAIALPAGDLYGFQASAANYYPVSDQLDTRDAEGYVEIERDLYLVPLKVNETIRLNNLFFDFAESELRPESQRELDRLASFLLKRSTIVIELSGHTDNVGSKSDNIKLSQLRVNAVKEYLVKKGLAESRMKAVGYGERKPLKKNSTEEGRQRNRRVEFKIVSM